MPGCEVRKGCAVLDIVRSAEGRVVGALVRGSGGRQVGGDVEHTSHSKRSGLEGCGCGLDMGWIRVLWEVGAGQMLTTPPIQRALQHSVLGFLTLSVGPTHVSKSSADRVDQSMPNSPEKRPRPLQMVLCVCCLDQTECVWQEKIWKAQRALG